MQGYNYSRSARTAFWRLWIPLLAAGLLLWDAVNNDCLFGEQPRTMHIQSFLNLPLFTTHYILLTPHPLPRIFSPKSPRGLIGYGPALVRFRRSAPILGNFAVFLHPVLVDADVCSPSGSTSISESSAQSHVDALLFTSHEGQPSSEHGEFCGGTQSSVMRSCPQIDHSSRQSISVVGRCVSIVLMPPMSAC